MRLRGQNNTTITQRKYKINTCGTEKKRIFFQNKLRMKKNYTFAPAKKKELN